MSGVFDGPAAAQFVGGRNIPALIAWIEAAQARGFAWRRGRDCVSFALGGVEAQTGVDLLADIDLWRTLREARVVAAKDGGLAAQLDARLDRVPPALAQRGDVAGLPDARFGVRLMLVEGRTLVGPGKHGLERLDRGAMVIGWNAFSARAGAGA